MLFQLYVARPLCPAFHRASHRRHYTMFYTTLTPYIFYVCLLCEFYFKHLTLKTRFYLRHKKIFDTFFGFLKRSIFYLTRRVIPDAVTHDPRRVARARYVTIRLSLSLSLSSFFWIFFLNYSKKKNFGQSFFFWLWKKNCAFLIMEAYGGVSLAYIGGDRDCLGMSGQRG